MSEILKATARYLENSFFFRKLLFLTLTSSNPKVYYTIALKLLAMQITKKINKKEKYVRDLWNNKY